MNSNDFYDELETGIKCLSSIFNEYKNKKDIEIEIRVGQIQWIQMEKFKTGLGSNEFFDKVKNILDNSKCWDKVINNKSDELCMNGIKRITSFNNKKILKHQCIKKQNIKNINLQYCGTPYDLRISVSNEIQTEDKIKNNTGTLRKKNRFSYYYKDYRIDLTHVEQISNGISEINYELELEFINLNSEVSDIYRAHSGLLLIRDIINMCEKIKEDSILKLSTSMDTN